MRFVSAFPGAASASRQVRQQHQKYSQKVLVVYIGIMEKKMETTIILGLYKDNEQEMETTIVYWGCIELILFGNMLTEGVNVEKPCQM